MTLPDTAIDQTLSHGVPPLGGVGVEAPGAATSPAAILTERFWESKRRRIRVNGPAANTRASSLGDDCERRLFYERTCPAEMRVAHGPELEAIFQLGNELEKIVFRELEEMGVEIVQRGRDFVDSRLRISAHSDAVLRIHEFPRPLPSEVKGLSPFAVNSIREWRDIRDHKEPHIRRYYSQLQTYLYFHEEELGLYVLKNKVSAAITFLECPLDYVFTEGLLKKAERIQRAVETDNPPDRHAGPWCERCPFVTVCCPDRNMGPGVHVLDDQELVAMLEKREALKAAAKEYGEIDEQVKAAIKAAPAAPEYLVGAYVIARKEVERRPYQVAAGKYDKIEIRRRA